MLYFPILKPCIYFLRNIKNYENILRLSVMVVVSPHLCKKRRSERAREKEREWAASTKTLNIQKWINKKSSRLNSTMNYNSVAQQVCKQRFHLYTGVSVTSLCSVIYYNQPSNDMVKETIDDYMHAKHNHTNCSDSLRLFISTFDVVEFFQRALYTIQSRQMGMVSSRSIQRSTPFK